MARSVRHFLGVLDELNHLGIKFISFRENIDTGGPLDRAVVVILGAIAELARNLIIEVFQKVWVQNLVPSGRVFETAF